MAQDLSHLQCTDVRRFHNSPTESHARFLHSFLSLSIRIHHTKTRDRRNGSDRGHAAVAAVELD